ncbi:AMP-binding protein [Robertmurraya sp. DFI.2.37]|uniref:AMP-binding protein n=1 Tax=Robertmurraya sp. DFI.2.37 TaxID=3031819 RepID=UPI001244D800|nr:AMP-binding protein [Robertmurraya sp. DFI.2.37]MDF1507845.1 AMP-binding protein [Robertmurraya sp. DFI.2.37]
MSIIVSYLAVLQNKDAVMLVNADLEESLLQTIIDSYQPAYIIGDVHHEDYKSIEAGILRRSVAPDYEIFQDVALLLSTSGTTGSLKFVKLSYENIAANAKSISEYLHLQTDDRGLVNLPIHYSYGISIINSHLHVGASILLTNDSIISKEFWKFVENEKATSLAGVPYTYQTLLRIGFQKMELPHLRYFTQAGGRLSEKHISVYAEYANRFAKKFYVMYGQTEAAPRISYVPPEELLNKIGSIGKAIPNGKLTIDEETGELIYEGPNVMLGYAKDFNDLARGDELNGKLHTGDIAEVDADGYFYIKGRMKRFIKLFGLRLNLDEIEKQLEKTLRKDVFCVGTDDKLFVVTDVMDLKDEIKRLIEDLYKLHRSAFQVKVVEDIPRLANGKVNYVVLKEMML